MYTTDQLLRKFYREQSIEIWDKNIWNDIQ